jgi:hypothetical protein
MTAQQFSGQPTQTPQGVPITSPQQYTPAFSGPMTEQQPSMNGTMPMNPYTKVPLLSRRRRFPNFY